MTEEATNGNNIGPPDIRTMGVISRAAFEVDDYWRIVEILHKRSLSFSRFDLIDTFFFIRSMAVNFFFSFSFVANSGCLNLIEKIGETFTRL